MNRRRTGGGAYWMRSTYRYRPLDSDGDPAGPWQHAASLIDIRVDFAENPAPSGEVQRRDSYTDTYLPYGTIRIHRGRPRISKEAP